LGHVGYDGIRNAHLPLLSSCSILKKDLTLILLPC